MGKKFISIIWGYHKQMYALSAIENYHLHAITSAKKAGYDCQIFSIGGDADIRSDPHLPIGLEITYYKSILGYFLFLIKNRNAVIYANSFVWQSLLVPFICRNAIFIGHDSVMRKTIFKQILQKYIFAFFKKIRTMTDEEKGFLAAQGVKQEKIFVLPLAVDNDTFTDFNQNHRQGIVFLGNVTPDKDIKTILYALAKAREKNPGITLDIIGEVRDDNFYTLTDQLNLHHAISVRGFIPHSLLCNELNKYVGYVNSSISEGQCLAAYEAALCGVSLCLPNTMSFSGRFKNGALFHEPGDFLALAHNLIEVVSNPNPDRIEQAKEIVIKNCNHGTIEEQEIILFQSDSVIETGKEIKNMAIFAPELHLPLIEGIQKSAFDFLKSLIGKGYQVQIFTQQSFGTRDLGLTAPVYYLNSNKIRLSKYLCWLWDSGKILNLVKKKEIKKIIIFSLDLPFLLSLCLAAFFYNQSEITVLIFSPRELNFFPSSILIRILKRRVHFIVRSAYAKSKLVQLGVSTERIRVCLPFPFKGKFMTHIMNNKRPKTLGYFSNAEASAGVLTVLELAAIMPEFRFILAIRDFDKENTDMQTLALKIEAMKLINVEIVRNIDNMPEFLSELEGIILPPLDMNVSMEVPMIMIEAFALKVPVFARELPIFDFFAVQGMVKSFKSVPDLKDKILAGVPAEAVERAHRFALGLPETDEFVANIIG